MTYSFYVVWIDRLVICSASDLEELLVSELTDSAPKIGIFGHYQPPNIRRIKSACISRRPSATT
jgi:hypothetical protein